MSSRSPSPPSVASAAPGTEPGVVSERTGAVAGLTTLSILAVAFGAMALGVPYFWIVFPVGFGGVLPLVLAYTGRRDRETESKSETGTRPSADPRDDALDVLRRQYAEGRLTDAAFERRVERLLETETVADATAWTRSTQRRPDDDGRTDGRGPLAETDSHRGRV